MSHVGGKGGAMSERTATVSSGLDAYLPQYDVLERAETEVGASAVETWCAILKTDLRDPVIAALFALPGFPNRMARRLGGLAAETRPGVVSFERIVAANRGWTVLAKEPGHELILGSISRFWRKGSSTRTVDPAAFAGFDEPGWAKVVLSFSVEPLGESRCVLRWEARAGGTDDAARSRFRRYWRVIRPGLTLTMKRALLRIRTEAEWHECLTGALADR